MIELQVAVILLAFGMMTIASLMTTQNRLLHRLRGDYQQDATLCLTRPNDPWIRQLAAPARITAGTITLPALPVVHALNTVTLVTHSQELTSETITVTVDVSELP